MSASSKKKVRKEQNAARMTEKQQKEQREAKKLKAYSIAFIAVVLAIVVIAVTVMAVKTFTSSGLMERKTVALTVGDHEINTIDMSYYYIDLINSTYNDWSSQYGSSMTMYLQMMGLDPTKPLSEQNYMGVADMTWSDYFISSAADRIASDYALYDKAVEAGTQLSEEDQENLDYAMLQMQLMAVSNGYSNFNSYLNNVYGPGSNEATYRAYMERSALAAAYYNEHLDSRDYDDAQIREYESDKFQNYSSFDFVNYYVNANSYLQGGTVGADGYTTYSDAEKNAARAAAKKAAEELSKATSVEELDKAIAAMDINKDNKNAASTKNEDVLYTSINPKIAEWLNDDSRKAGDITYIVNESTSTDEDGNEVKSVNGYTVVLFQERDDNMKPLANVRHLLVAFEGGEKDENGNTVYSDADKAAAMATAEELLNTWKTGEATEESFAALVTEHTDDTASAETGGLYEDITPQKDVYEEGFFNWSIDDARKAGDVDIVETSYGYHIMYYVGDDELTYRDYLIFADLKNEEMQAWYNDIVENVTIEEGNTSRLKQDIILAPAS